jgi:hypothetical protein
LYNAKYILPFEQAFVNKKITQYAYKVIFIR